MRYVTNKEEESGMICAYSSSTRDCAALPKAWDLSDSFSITPYPQRTAPIGLKRSLLLLPLTPLYTCCR